MIAMLALHVCRLVDERTGIFPAASDDSGKLPKSSNVDVRPSCQD